jgi:hypothetical protein
MTEICANLLVTKLNDTGHRAEMCELLCDENSTIHDNLVSLGEERAPVVVPTSVQELSRCIEQCFKDGLSPLEVLTQAAKTVLCC